MGSSKYLILLSGHAAIFKMLLSVSKQSFKTVARIAAIHAVVGLASKVYIAGIVVAHGHAPALLAAD